MQLEASDPRWSALFTAERERLLTALGRLVEGGMAEQIVHVGATAVPGVPTRPVVDIAVGVFPFPPVDAVLERLVGLGYTPLGAPSAAGVQLFGAADDRVLLHVAMVGDDPLQAMALVRDYLREDAAGRAGYSAAKAQLAALDAAGYAAAHARLLDTTLAAAKAWFIASRGFGPVHAIVRELEGFERPWYISSGWALELLRGSVTRLHHDVDVVVARADQLLLQAHMHERGWRFVTPYRNRLEPWPERMRLELPRHQALAFKDDGFVDFLLSEIDDGIWRYRREPTVVCHTDQLGLCTPEGIPFLAPEVVLLFKSKNTSNQAVRSQDQQDYAQTKALLTPAQRAWLRWALLRSDPEHAWIAELA